MLNIKVIVVGKLKEKYLTDACGEYIKRIGRFASITVTEISECRLSDEPTEKEIEKALEREGENIIKAASGYVIPMCIEGKHLTSEQLADKMEQIPLDGNSTVSFIIGSSHGLAENVKKIGQLKLSMSNMTFPHQLARVMLLEQIYRAFMINGGGRYHK